MLTNEDHLIFRARMSVATQARLHTQDREDFATMRTSEYLRRINTTPAERCRAFDQHGIPV